MSCIWLGFTFCMAAGLGGMRLVPASALLAVDPVPPLDPVDPVPPPDPVAPCAAANMGPAATTAISVDTLTARPTFLVNIGSPPVR
jgi:hypothetical protein